MAVRVGVEDERNGVSFRAPLAWTLALIAACCGRPRTVEDCLQRLDTYRRGFAADLSLALMEPEHRHDPSLDAHDGPTAERARWMGAPGEEGVVYVDLARRALTATGAAQQRLAVRGEVEMMQGAAPTGCRVTYVLPPERTLRAAVGAAR